MEEEEEQFNISPVGLVNLSRYQKIKGYNYYKTTNLFNSCYINARIQCLFRFDGFINKIKKYDSYKGDLVRATQNLIHQMQISKNKKNKQC